jgi:hypothetical protein
MAPLAMFLFLHEFPDVFHLPITLPPSRDISNSIDHIPRTSQPNAPSYILDPKEATEIKCQINQLLKSGQIHPSSSPCAYLAFIIPKKDTSEWRLVTDYSTLKKSTIKNCYLLPQTEDILDNLQGAYFFTMMDLTSRYHQVCMKPTNI